MLGSSSPATATLHTTTSSATPTSPTRPSRLRGLSYLRNYTHNHLHGSSSQRAEQQAQQQHAQAQAHTQQQQQQQQSPHQEPKREQRPGLGRRSISSPGESSNTPAEPRRSGSQSGIQSGENGWVPTVQGRSGLSRQAIDLTSTDTHPVQRETSQSPNAMTRSRAATAVAPLSSAKPSSGAPAAKEAQPTIRFIPHVEVRSTRPSLHFSAVSRTLKNASTVVRVGRYSERDSDKAEENSLPVGFKSKVVSRRHCEFWCTSGQWYVKDVKSSSGTFLNHVRLSSPGVESRPYPVNDGDVVQLGIDFKGGEEVIFRCVKIRVECNRGWQKSLNNFNTSTHKRLLKSAGVGGGKSKNRDSDAASVNSSECSICLNPVAPCQALFVAPCSHVWHYKCVRNLIHGPNWPNFLCPNCRFVADLEADVEPLEEEEEEEEAEEVEFEATQAAVELDESAELDQSGETGVSSDDAVEGVEEPTTPADLEMQDHDQQQQQQQQNHEPQPSPPPSTSASHHDNSHTSTIPTDELAHLSLQPPTSTSTSIAPPPTSSATTATDPTSPSNPIAIQPPKSRAPPPPPDLLSARSATPRSTTPFALAASLVSEAEGEAEGEGPGTPRNGAGPFLLDGQGARGEGREG